MTKTRSKPRIVREQVGLPDRSLQFKNIDEGYRVFFKVFTTVLQHLLLSLVLQDQREFHKCNIWKLHNTIHILTKKK